MFGIKEYKFYDRKWHIKERYRSITVVSKYSCQCDAMDTKTHERVLIKQICLDNDDDIMRAYEEIMVLKEINHDNVVKLVDRFTKSSSINDFKVFYMVLNYMDTTLRDVIKTQKLSDGQIKFLAYQILRGLKYIHSMGVIHKDLNPCSIGINKNLELRIKDFNFNKNENRQDCIGYNTSRYYKAPEIQLQKSDVKKYRDVSDIWSVGCIIAEMYTHEKLFLCKKDSEQLKITFKLFPPHQDSDIQKEFDLLYGEPSDRIPDNDEYNTVNKRFRIFHIKEMNNIRGFIEKLLETDPEQRLTASKALEQEYIMEFHDPDDEPSNETALGKIEGSLNNSSNHVNILRSKIYEELFNLK